MSDTTTPEGQAPDGMEPTEDTQAVTAPSDSEGQAPQDDEFDKERALATIRKLRETEKQATRERKELEQLRAERKAAEDAKLSEQERLTQRLTEMEAERERERAAARDREMRYQVQIAAQSMNIVDPDAAVKLLDWSAVEDGDVTGALKALVEEKPYLLRQDQPAQRSTAPSVSPTNASTRTSASNSRIYTAAEMSDRAFWNANKADILKALREGRVQD